MSKSPARILAWSAMAIWLGLAVTAASQTSDNVIVRVNNRAITEADVKMAEVEIIAQLAVLPADRRRQAILDYLVDGQLLADAAEKERLDKQSNFEGRRQYYLRRALRDAYFEDRIRDSITEEEVRRAYEEQAALAKLPTEYRIHQILVGTEFDARDVRLKLASGSDFAQLAKQRSLDTGTAANGGDLGYIVQGQLDPDFEKVVTRLHVGEVSNPIKTRFGWHIARLDDRRTRTLPTWEEAKELVRLELLARRTRDAVTEMRRDASIVYTNPDDEPVK